LKNDFARAALTVASYGIYCNVGRGNKTMRKSIARLAGNVPVAALLIVLLIGAGGCMQPDVQYRGMAAPPTEFLIGPEDVLIVTVWRNQELSKEVIVRPDGKISLPLLGDIMAAGLTAQALSKQVADGLA